MTLLRIKEAANYSGLHPHTLRKYIDSGMIKGVRIGTHRFVDNSELNRWMNRSSKPVMISDNATIIYARVSTRKQATNLVRQRERLVTYCQDQGLEIVEVIEDITSGVNERRRGLQKLLKLVRSRQTRFVVVEYKARLARCGLTYLLDILRNNDVQLIVVQSEQEIPEEDLVQDLITIVTSFSARLYGKRGAKKIIRTIREENQTYNRSNQR